MSAHPNGELRCLIAAGGTAGHVLPSLAVAEALRERGVHVTFAGSPDRVEARLVPEAGYELDTFEIAGFPRRPSVQLLRSLITAGRAPRACAAILKRRLPHVVLGGGGYVAGPMVYAAWRRKLPAALTEADAHLGLANRLGAPFARRIFLAYGIVGRDGSKYRVTGRPVPRAHLGVSQEEGRRRFGISGDTSVVAFFGALAGARSLNDFAVETYGDSGPTVLHVSGERDYEGLRGRVHRDDYLLLSSTNEFGAALAAPDVAISRAGGTVWELAAAGTPAILVPYPHATADHQTLNARHFERGGGAVVVPEPELGRVPAVVDELLADRPRLESMRAAMLSMARPHAADEIAEELIALAAAQR
jgi:UDP-N-acetylglucosamine--N-acetylmuramyl-(pentapeptide) pyrophosphoryl-undecaprenol N-acetylglucosamine transferase